MARESSPRSRQGDQMNLLESELVKKCFGCSRDFICPVRHLEPTRESKPDYRCLSVRVLDAMQRPINVGDRCLAWTVGLTAGWTEWTCYENTILGSACWHPNYLRLPDAFQKRECERSCSNTHSLLGRNPCPCSCHQWPSCAGEKPTKREPPSAIEEKMADFLVRWRIVGNESMNDLRELVRMARKSA